MKSMDTIDPISIDPVEVSGIRELTALIRNDVRRHTGGRVHNLTVVMTGTHVVLDLVVE